MTKHTVNKQMIRIGYFGDWQIVDVIAETDVSIWIKPRFVGVDPPRHQKISSDSKYYDLSEIDTALSILRRKADTAREKAITAANRLAQLDIYKANLEKRED